MLKDFIKKIIPSFLLDFYHFLLALIGAFVYWFPSRKLIVVGVTGTSGKTTVVDLVAKVLGDAGYGVASLSSIKFKIKNKEWPNTLKMTMPGRFKIQRFLRQAANEHCDYAVLEVTSEGIKQHRHRFIDFEIAVFTNLSPEHIERHGSFGKYRAAKGEFFQACKNIHIINIDDKNSDYFWSFPAKEKKSYQLKGDKIFIDGSSTLLNLKLTGEFNLYNAAAAISVGLSQGIDLAICRRAVEKVENIPGRMETVIREPFKVIVDYAHTPDALEKVYKVIDGRKICVLGAAGGGRDKWKRPELGRIAARYCDEIILANEDPYDEPPEKILEDIKRGITHLVRPLQKCYTILDRREAIRKALSLAKPGDIVIITGKGSEPWMCVAGGKKIPWSDRQIVIDNLPLEKYEILEHKADLKIGVFGRDKKELFLNALLGMEAGLKPEIRAKSAKRKIKITSPDLNALLVDFLSEVLYLIQVNKEIYDKVKFIKFSDVEIEAELSGGIVERFGEDIKAVTYHNLDIRQKKDRTWEAVILFDI